MNLARQGKKHSGSGDFTYYDLNGQVVGSGAFSITARRIMVEAPKP